MTKSIALVAWSEFLYSDCANWQNYKSDFIYLPDKVFCLFLSQSSVDNRMKKKFSNYNYHVTANDIAKFTEENVYGK